MLKYKQAENLAVEYTKITYDIACRRCGKWLVKQPASFSADRDAESISSLINAFETARWKIAEDGPICDICVFNTARKV